MKEVVKKTAAMDKLENEIKELEDTLKMLTKKNRALLSEASDITLEIKNTNKKLYDLYLLLRILMKNSIR